MELIDTRSPITNHIMCGDINLPIFHDKPEILQPQICRGKYSHIKAAETQLLTYLECNGFKRGHTLPNPKGKFLDMFLYKGSIDVKCNHSPVQIQAQINDTAHIPYLYTITQQQKLNAQDISKNSNLMKWVKDEVFVDEVCITMCIYFVICTL